MNPKIVGSTVVSTTDAQTLATQVTNYKKKAASTTKATRTIDASNTDIFEGVIDMPAEPVVLQKQLTWSQLHNGQHYLVMFLKFHLET